MVKSRYVLCVDGLSSMTRSSDIRKGKVAQHQGRNARCFPMWVDFSREKHKAFPPMLQSQK
jgi:hypothetical protein